MFSQLLSQCEQVFKSVQSTLKQNNQIFKQSRKYHKQRQLYGLIDPTKTAANCISFSKSQRFKNQQKQQIQINQLNISSNTIEIHHQNQQLMKNKKNTYTFRKSQRFLNNKQEQTKSILYPNYQIIKKNNKNAPIIKPSSSKDLSKSNVSIMTAATLNQLGPGKYFIQNDLQKSKNVISFSKDKRFTKQKPIYQDNPLFISQSQTRRRPPTAVIKKKIVKNTKLISLQQQDQLRQRLKLTYWNSIPLQLDRLFKNKNGAIIRQNYFNIKKLTGRQKRSAILMMLDRLNWLRGGYQNNIQTNILDEKKCVVKYRKSTPKPFKFVQMQPGPDYYYPQDDLIKNHVIGYSFGKQGVQDQQIKYDDRDYQIKEQIFKKGGNIVINPLHTEHKLTQYQIKSLQRGPGYYDCLFGQVEKRGDIGVLKFQEITQKNARQNNCIQIQQVNDGVYYPSYTAIDPNIPTLLYKQAANIKPIHLPDKLLFPQHWVFYDGDLNKVKAEIAKNVILAKNMDYKEYQTYTVKFQAFKSYLKQREPIPDIGEYDVKYGQLDAHVEGFEMGKMQQKNLIQPIVKQQGEVDGDNLILNPRLLQNHLPNFNFGKLVPRQQFQQDNSQFNQAKQGDRLILQPKLLDKKLANIKFQNYIGRQDNKYQNNDQPVQGNVLILNPKQVEKHLPQINMARQADKHQPVIQQIYDDREEIIINLDRPKKVKGFVEMERMSVVRLVPQLKKIKETTLRSKQQRSSKKLQ